MVAAAFPSRGSALFFARKIRRTRLKAGNPGHSTLFPFPRSSKGPASDHPFPFLTSKVIFSSSSTPSARFCRRRSTEHTKASSAHKSLYQHLHRHNCPPWFLSCLRRQVREIGWEASKRSSGQSTDEKHFLCLGLPPVGFCLFKMADTGKVENPNLWKEFESAEGANNLYVPGSPAQLLPMPMLSRS